MQILLFVGMVMKNSSGAVIIELPLRWILEKYLAQYWFMRDKWRNFA